MEEIRRDDSTDNFPQYIMYFLCLMFVWVYAFTYFYF